jgi:alkylated DNA nucleotide flippase Atl1
MEINVTKEQVTAALQECAAKLGRVPTYNELAKLAGISRRVVRRLFGTYTRALRECNREIKGGGRMGEMNDLFLDWAGVVRKLNKLPTLFEYEEHSRYSQAPLMSRFGTWSQVPRGLKQYAEEKGWSTDWKDVLAMIEGREKGLGERAVWQERAAWLESGSGPGPADGNLIRGPIILRDRPMYGRVMRPYPLICGPVNEMGVVFLFGAVAERLGFWVLRIQAEYPDCEALRLVSEDRLQLVRIEFENESRNFLKHMHDASECDLIVCWKHNWPECPLEVVELKTVLSDRLSAFSQEMLAADLRK